ncbi:MAG: ATP-binding protein [Deltaproteobacteria bacterium]|nr:ATP-binding protein [Candidatus Zymogenaceae bacterium]
MSKDEEESLTSRLLKNRINEKHGWLFEKQTKNGFLVPLIKEVFGQIFFGFILGTRRKAGLLFQEFNQHLLASARTGAGKTTFLRLLFSQLYLLIPCWFFDFKKDYRNFITQARHLLVFSWRDFKFNPLRPPPGTDPLKWIQVVADIFCMSFGLMAGAKSFIIDVLEELYRIYGVFDGSDTYPTMLDFHEMLERKDRKKGMAQDDRGYLARTKNKTTASIKILGKMFDCDQGYPLEDLVDKNVVFELDGLIDELQVFLVDIILGWIFTYRIDKGERGQLRQVVFFDEAFRIFRKDYRSDSGTSHLETMVTQIREFGVGLVMATQMLHSFSDVVKSNVYTHVVMSQSDGNETEEAARTLRLTKEQADYLARLEVGQAVVKLAGRYPDPFVIEIPNVPIDRYVTDDEVRRHMESEYGI